MIEHPSGDLAAYVLGSLDASDRAVVESHLDTCASCREEALAYGGTLWTVATVGIASLAPQPGLRGRIVARAEFPRGAPEPLSSLFRRPVPVFVPLALAVLLVISLAALAGARGEADAYAAALTPLPGARVVALAATADAPTSTVRGSLVIPPNGRPYLVLDLPAAPAGKAWEAWVIRGDRPEAAGMGRPSRPSTGVFMLLLTTALRPGDAVAVTLELAEGATAPTTKPVLVGGS